MQNLGIIGFGWLGNHIAERLLGRYKIFATTTTPAKAQELNNKGYHATLTSFPDTLDAEMQPWTVAKDLDAIIISVPFSGLRGAQIPMNDKRQNLLNFLRSQRSIVFNEFDRRLSSD